jgi:hypothetical protein
MRIDMPSCSFTDCRHNQDNNCFAKGGNREGCEFKILDEKQTPKEPDFIPCDQWGKTRPICPVCHSKVDGYLKDVYCHNCGQALKWGE